MSDGLELSSLSIAGYYSIESVVGAKSISRGSSRDESLGHGVLDPITATVLVSLATIQALSLWLSKNRKKVELARTETVKALDGSEKTVRTSVVISCETTDAEVAKQIAKFAGLGLGKHSSD